MNRAVYVLAAALAAWLAPGRALAAVDFQRDVRPILSQHCFKCHGPDDNARKAKLRLDLPSGLAKAKHEEAIRRIESDDATEIMPPPATKKPLTAAQKATLKQWIEAGAVYADHWAFV